MDELWSMSTTLRNPNRIIGFLNTALELDGVEWNNENQIKFQILLIKNRQYLNSDKTQDYNKLSSDQINILKDKKHQMTFKEAEGIFLSKNYKDPSMRGRQSMSPLHKLGLIFYDKKIIHISDVGHKLINNTINFEDFMLDSLLKLQYPNQNERKLKNWNTKPFINTLRLIKVVNEKCRINSLKEKGISKIEFGIFVLSLKSYKSINSVADEILKFRQEYESLDNKHKSDYVKSFTESYLKNFKNPIKNMKEYTDNIIRYLRLTKYIFIRGKYSNTYIDLEPRRLIEINAILNHDNGSAKEFTKDEWNKYLGTYGSYELPFETIDKLTEILHNIEIEIKDMSCRLGVDYTQIPLPNTKDKLQDIIQKRREYRTSLQNLKIKKDYSQDIKKIDKAIEYLTYLKDHDYKKLVNKPSVELEKWSNIGLNIINDSKLIKPNYPVGDDNEPIFTAPAGIPDIECYYENFDAICEVTMLTNRDQWFNEGQPVMRHLRDFEEKNSNTPHYCLFIAPKLHEDTLETFYTSIKYEYKGKPQKIVPITIKQFIKILETIKELILLNKTFKHDNLIELYESCTDYNKIEDSTKWQKHIEKTLNGWSEQLISD